MFTEVYNTCAAHFYFFAIKQSVSLHQVDTGILEELFNSPDVPPVDGSDSQDTDSDVRPLKILNTKQNCKRLHGFYKNQFSNKI